MPAPQKIIPSYSTAVSGNTAPITPSRELAIISAAKEIHSEEWIHKTIQYLDDCRHHKTRTNMFSSLQPTNYDEAPPFKCLLTYKWFLAVYIRDVWSRLPFLLAETTSVFGSILKIDSTKKICRKLQGADAMWATNVGNERGEILITVLTEALRHLPMG